MKNILIAVVLWSDEDSRTIKLELLIVHIQGGPRRWLADSVNVYVSKSLRRECDSGESGSVNEAYIVSVCDSLTAIMN